jgi:hypothetical protein
LHDDERLQCHDKHYIESPRLFPRYRLDEAIEVEIERITAQQCHSLEEARILLLNAGRHALSLLLGEFQEPEACAALTDERESPRILH